MTEILRGNLALEPLSARRAVASAVTGYSGKSVPARAPSETVSFRFSIKQMPTRFVQQLREVVLQCGAEI